jgi:transmembrane sensor
MNTSDDDILKQFGLENDKELDRFLKESSNLKLPKAPSKEAAWQRLEQAILLEESNKKVAKEIPLRYILAVAASVTILLFSWWGFYRWNHINYVTEARQILTVPMPDGSQVTLNAQSGINWRKTGWHTNRIVYLNGEGLFKIKKGSSFTVKSGHNSVTVLGTEFDVQSRNNLFEVKCYKGKVSVQLQKGNPIILTKGQGVKKEEGITEAEKFAVDPNLKDSWIKGEFYFDNADIQQVLDEISRQFNVHINYNFEKRRYSGYFRNTSLDSALMNVCFPLGLNYSVKADSVFIKK